MDGESHSLADEGTRPHGSASDEDDPAGSTTDGDDPAGRELETTTAVPRAATSLVPSVLSGFDGDDETARRSGHAACLLVAAWPRLARPMTERLLATLAGNDRPEPVLRTLSALEDAAPEAVQRTLSAVVAAGARARVYGAIHRADPWRHPGRLRTDGGQAAALDGPDPVDGEAVLRQVVRLVEGDGRGDDGAEARPVTAPSRGDARERGQSGARRRTDSQDRRRTDSQDRRRTDSRARSGVRDRANRDGDGSTDASNERSRLERLSHSELVTAIRLQAGFDELRITEPPTRWRYGRVLRARAVVDGDPLGVAIRLPHRPDDAPGFDGSLADALVGWERLAPIDGTVSVLGWGDRPWPWLATTYVEETLADHVSSSGDDGPPDAGRALEGASALAAALADLHGHDVVHGGIDPRNVARPVAYFDEPVRPRLDNVGLVGAYRAHAGLPSLLDLRYAAPEHVDSRYGRIDHATDVYGLGATCYYRCTGRHPFAGSDREVRSAVLEERPPPPSTVNPDLPAAIDDVLARALSKTKLARYETATQLHADLAALAESTRA